jgi:hypothetical protein
MNKAILVIDMPESCDKCPLVVRTGAYDSCCITGTCIISNDNFKFSWCPLMSAPEEQEIWHGDDSSDWVRGYNSCLHEIVGE